MIYKIKNKFDIKRFLCYIFKENILTENKRYEIIKKILIKLKEILEDNPEFTGSVTENFYMGGLVNINKSEDLKIK